MSEVENFKVNLNALISWSSMPDSWRSLLRDTFNKLAETSPNQRPSWVYRLARPENWHMLHGPEDLRVFFRWVEGEPITIMDFISQETLDRYATPTT